MSSFSLRCQIRLKIVEFKRFEDQEAGHTKVLIKGLTIWAHQVLHAMVIVDEHRQYLPTLLISIQRIMRQR